MSEMDWKAVRETLLHNPKQARLDDKDKEELNVYCKDYMQFMDRAKTEREAVEVAVEAARAAEAGAATIGLGPRILRCETAPVAALAAVMAFAGELE